MSDSKLKNWLPACFHTLSQSETHLSGYVSSESELQSVLECYSRVTLTSFVKWSDDKARIKKSGSKRRLLWKFEDYSNDVPLTIQNRQILSCQFGKAKPKPEQQQTEDHHTYSRKKRFHIQKSRKVDCPAKVYIRHVLRYDDYKVPKNTSKLQKQIVLDNLNAHMSESEEIPSQLMIHIKLPFIEAHQNHKISLESGFARRIHPEIRNKIYEYVSNGVTSVPLLKRALKQHVLTELCKNDDVKPHLHDRCYFPSNAVIRNHVHLALVAGQYSGLDQENLQWKVDQWQLSDPSAGFFLRKCMEGTTSTLSHTVKPEGSGDSSRLKGFPSDTEDDVDDEECSSEGRFLFIHQTEKQRKLLERYGEMVLLDATYRTTKYALPLFLMVVRTNVSYLPVAQFICENETTQAISEALQMMKLWNPNWKPKYFMLDYSEQEFQALHRIFPESKKYLCSFHREQAWIRWTRENKNQLSTPEKEDLLKHLRRIALSANEVACDREIKQLRDSALYQTNIRVKNYVENRWLDIREVINSYLACLKAATNTSGSNHVFVLPSYTAVLWDLGRMDTWLFKKVKFTKFSWIFQPINVNKCHWILLAADVPHRTVSLLDSMHGKSEKYLDMWRRFMQIRDSQADEKLGEWTNGTVTSAKQEDGNTCGAFVMLNALALTRGIPPYMLRHADAVSMRKLALGTIMDAAVKPPSQRTMCDMVGCLKLEEQQDWIACDVCGRWCHFKCVNIKRNPKGSYVCPICKAQYD